ncbi:hypothetical protein CEUSTIGMA_g1335.t1 [Chlamydomonas eustigma]|uniref:DUF5745 domain-containing protein n=1 Tax=Chlamydomonas eustigma TaxID=1157962 RepID=A0A250WST5_9CHLO|nr:hypothetical protein CEUSTIGMA_g1335.t1 [Chlamydomonas eustigma]|eukprot:GAX73885.1 hypothetical protein CEUSTIGMA_g1335.t1 [Chlamydomonas eustigma]
MLLKVSSLSQLLGLELSHISGSRIAHQQSLSDIQDLMEIVAALLRSPTDFASHSLKNKSHKVESLEETIQSKISNRGRHAINVVARPHQDRKVIFKLPLRPTLSGETEAISSQNKAFVSTASKGLPNVQRAQSSTTETYTNDIVPIKSYAEPSSRPRVPYINNSSFQPFKRPQETGRGLNVKGSQSSSSPVIGHESAGAAQQRRILLNGEPFGYHEGHSRDHKHKLKGLAVTASTRDLLLAANESDTGVTLGGLNFQPQAVTERRASRPTASVKMEHGVFMMDSRNGGTVERSGFRGSSLPHHRNLQGMWEEQEDPFMDPYGAEGSEDVSVHNVVQGMQRKGGHRVTRKTKLRRRKKDKVFRQQQMAATRHSEHPSSQIPKLYLNPSQYANLELIYKLSSADPKAKDVRCRLQAANEAEAREASSLRYRLVIKLKMAAMRREAGLMHALKAVSKKNEDHLRRVQTQQRVQRKLKQEVALKSQHMQQELEHELKVKRAFSQAYKREKDWLLAVRQAEALEKKGNNWLPTWGHSIPDLGRGRGAAWTQIRGTTMRGRHIQRQRMKRVQDEVSALRHV